MARLRLREIAEAARTDPKKALLESLGDMSGVEIFHNQVMVATHIRPSITAGGIHLPDSALQEDRFQGKAGLVVKVGPLAFKDDHIAKFGGVEIKEGDWVFYRPSDGMEIHFVNTYGDGTSCRILDDTHVKGRISDPAKVW